MKIKLTCIFLFLLLLSCARQKKIAQIGESSKNSLPDTKWSITSTNKWLVNKGLSNVESIIYDKANLVYYATNGKSYEIGNSGFISRISEKGVLKELKWVSELNRPTGMAIYDSLLYVADVNSLIVINTRTGNIVKTHMEPIANSGLNDVAVNKQGEVFVSASFIHSIFKLEKGDLELFSKDEENLKWANGIIAMDRQLIVAGLNLSIIDLESKKISSLQLNIPVEDFDGIISDQKGGYFMTTVGNSGLFHLDKEMKVSKLLEEGIYFGDLEFRSQQRKIFVPRGNKEKNEFFISVFKMDFKTND